MSKTRSLKRSLVERDPEVKIQKCSEVETEDPDEEIRLVVEGLAADVVNAKRAIRRIESLRLLARRETTENKVPIRQMKMEESQRVEPDENKVHIPNRQMKMECEESQRAEPSFPKLGPDKNKIPIRHMEMDSEESQRIEPIFPKKEPDEGDEKPNVRELDELDGDTPDSTFGFFDFDGDDDTQSIEPIEDPDEMNGRSDSDHELMLKDMGSEADVKEEPDELSMRNRGDILIGLSHGELLGRMILMKYVHLDCPAHTALKTKKERFLLNVLVEAKDQPVKITLSEWGSVPYFDTYIEDEVTLDPGADYNAQLIKLLSTMLKTYDVSCAAFELRELCFGDDDVELPFEGFFGHRPAIVEVLSLNINNKELAPLIHYAHPKELKISFPSKHLFYRHPMWDDTDVTSLEIDGRNVDNVDELMERFCANHIKLGSNCWWSARSFDRVMTEHANGRGNIGRTIECRYVPENNMKKYQKSRLQWNELLSNWRTSYKDDNPKYSTTRITMTSTDIPKPAVTFLLDFKVIKPPFNFSTCKVVEDSDGYDNRRSTMNYNFYLQAGRREFESYATATLIELIAFKNSKIATEVLRGRNVYLDSMTIWFNSKVEVRVTLDADNKPRERRNPFTDTSCREEVTVEPLNPNIKPKLDVRFITNLIHGVIRCYNNISEAGFYFYQMSRNDCLTPEVPLAMEAVFGKPSDDPSKKIKLARLTIEPAAMVSVLRWFSPKVFIFYRTAQELFDDDGNLMIDGVEELTLGDVVFPGDNVDRLMRACTAKKITLTEHTEWSDRAIFDLLKDHVKSGCSPVVPRTIIYKRVDGQYRRSYSDWQKFFVPWKEWYEANKAKDGGKVELRVSKGLGWNKICIELSLL